MTPKEATVVNTSCGRVLKGMELYLRYGRGKNRTLALPADNGNGNRFGE